MAKDGLSLNREFQDEALKRAKDAAASGDPISMVEALHQSGYIDGLTAQMRKKWGKLSYEDLESIVADAVNNLYVAVRNGKKIFDLKPYLWKSSDNMANDFYRIKKVEAELTDNIQATHFAPQVQEEQLEYPYDDMDPDEKLKLAIGIARSLISKLGQKNTRQVMEYIFDAIEAGREDVTTEEICEALGYSNRGTVRVWIQRGFDRLAQRAQAEGILERGFDINSLKKTYGV